MDVVVLLFEDKLVKEVGSRMRMLDGGEGKVYHLEKKNCEGKINDQV